MSSRIYERYIPIMIIKWNDFDRYKVAILAFEHNNVSSIKSYKT